MPAPKSNTSLKGVIDHLNAAAQTKPVNHSISLDKYYRSAALLQRQADQYRRSKNLEQLYVILLRFVSLGLETIPNHYAYSKSNPNANNLRASCLAIMSELEGLKAKLKLLDIAKLEEAPFSPTSAPQAVKVSSGHVSGINWDGTASTNTDIDLELLEKLGKPDWFESLPTPPSSSSANRQQHDRQQQKGQLADLKPSMSIPTASAETLLKHAILPTSSSALDNNIDTSSTDILQTNSQQNDPAALKVPSSYATLLSSIQRPSPQAQQHHPYPSPYAGELQLGPQELAVQSVPYPTQPPLPGDSCCQPLPPPPPPSPTISMTPSTTPHGGVPEVKKRQRMRDVHISAALMDTFLRYAVQNTHRGIETCGILAGTLSPDDARFTINALIVPKQEGTSDTVQALAEEEIFDVQDKKGLYPMGWIHTHPTQTCFLSSVDVHTQCGYQTMLDEAVAIVMAPRDSSSPVGIFRLSTPGGLNLVQRCPLRGFHAHPPTETGQVLYELCNHVYLNPRIKYEVLDLR